MVFLVEDVPPNSLAEKAGIRPGDGIVKVNSLEFFSLDELRALLNHGNPGDYVELLVSRLNSETKHTDRLPIRMTLDKKMPEEQMPIYSPATKR
jgi:S1-C subfamily serine protease